MEMELQKYGGTLAFMSNLNKEDTTNLLNVSTVSLVRFCQFGPKLIWKTASRRKTNFMTNVCGTIHSLELKTARFSTKIGSTRVSEK